MKFVLRSALFVLFMLAVWLSLNLAVYVFSAEISAPSNAAADTRLIIGGGGGVQPEEKGLKPFSPGEKFDVPSPFEALAVVIRLVVYVVCFVLHLLLIAFVVWTVVRVAHRKREKHVEIIEKTEETVYDIFDSTLQRLKERRQNATNDISEIDKRVSSK